LTFEELVIELGSSNTCIFEKGAGLVLKEASLVAFTRKNKKIIVKEVGNKAKKMIGKTSESIWVESPIKNGVIINKDLAELMLRSFLSKIFGNRKFLPRLKILFVCNCAIDGKEKREFETLGYNIGASIVNFVPSVITSAYGGGLDINESYGKMIVNIGADTTQIGVISLGSIVTGYSVALGGSVIDSAIVKYVYDNYNTIISESSAEKIKCEIGSLYNTDVSNIEFIGVDALTRATRTDVIFAKDLYPVIEIAYNKICSAIQIVINEISPDLVGDIAQNGIYVCGGGALMTGTEEYFRRQLRLNITIFENSQDVSILGGGKLLSDKSLLENICDNN
jgi:rod shape-determining protein MreB and related proteins